MLPQSGSFPKNTRTCSASPSRLLRMSTGMVARNTRMLPVRITPRPQSLAPTRHLRHRHRRQPQHPPTAHLNRDAIRPRHRRSPHHHRHQRLLRLWCITLRQFLPPPVKHRLLHLHLRAIRPNRHPICGVPRHHPSPNRLPLLNPTCRIRHELLRWSNGSHLDTACGQIEDAGSSSSSNRHRSTLRMCFQNSLPTITKNGFIKDSGTDASSPLPNHPPRVASSVESALVDC